MLDQQMRGAYLFRLVLVLVELFKISSCWRLPLGFLSGLVKEVLSVVGLGLSDSPSVWQTGSHLLRAGGSVDASGGLRKKKRRLTIV